MKKRIHEKILFDHPVLYKIKGLIIEGLIWNIILGRIFRMKSNPLPDISGNFVGRRVLIASCGPNDSTIGPPIVGASKVTAFDLSYTFATKCATKRKDWNVYCGDVCNMPHRDKEFDISVIYVSLHHIPVDAQKILGEMARVTRERIIIVECLLPARGLLRRMLRLWYRITDGGHHYYTLDDLKDVFNRLGLQVISSYKFSPIKHMWLGVLNCHPDGSPK